MYISKGKPTLLLKKSNDHKKEQCDDATSCFCLLFNQATRLGTEDDHEEAVGLHVVFLFSYQLKFNFFKFIREKK